MARHVIQTLAIANVMKTPIFGLTCILACVTSLATMIASLSPFWFAVSAGGHKKYVDVLGGHARQDHIGMYGYLTEDNSWINLNMLQKSRNQLLVPDIYKAGQVIYTLGIITSYVTNFAMVILVLLPYKHITAEIGCAGGALATFVCQLMGVIFVIISSSKSATCNGSWCKVLWTELDYVYGGAEWAFYIAALACVIALAVAILMWLNMFQTCRQVEYVRATPYDPLKDEPLYYRFDYRKVLKPKVICPPKYEQPISPTRNTGLYRYPPSPSYSQQPNLSYQPQPSFDRSSQSSNMVTI